MRCIAKIVAVGALILFTGRTLSGRQSKSGEARKVVPREVMERIYEQVKTPYKYGVILTGENGANVDCPSVFRHRSCHRQRQGISDDPQIVRRGPVWVMHYFGAFGKPKAFDTFACSYDLAHWTQYGTGRT